ncbi:MAG: hypothetical protein V1743_05295 [Nanoarchaeota archaeon]
MRKIIGLGIAAGLVGILAATATQGEESEGWDPSAKTGETRPQIQSAVKVETQVPFYEFVYVREPASPDTSTYNLQKQEWSLEAALGDTVYWQGREFDPAKVPKTLYTGVFKPGNVLSGFALKLSQLHDIELGYVDLLQQNRHLGDDMKKIPVGAKVTYTEYWQENDVRKALNANRENRISMMMGN